MADPTAPAPRGNPERMLGQRLDGRYLVHALLGEGGMGAVYRATDERLGRDVAVKLLRVEAATPEEGEALRGRFHREARSAAALRHPNVLTVHDFGTDARLGEDYIVMELLPGRDVADRLAEAGGALPVAEAVEIFREACMGLAAGHRAGLVHRDVKPRNVFLVADPDGGWEVKVVDFGIARMGPADDADGDGRPGPHTPRYAAPEQRRGEPLTPACDVYALALTALEMLTGRHPAEVHDATDDSAAERALDALRAARPDLPPAVADVLRRALRRDPAHRFPDGGALLSVLDRALREGGGDVLPLAPVVSGRSAAAREDDRTELLTPPPAPVRAPEPAGTVLAASAAAPPVLVPDPGREPGRRRGGRRPAEPVARPHRTRGIAIVNVMVPAVVLGVVLWQLPSAEGWIDRAVAALVEATKESAPPPSPVPRPSPVEPRRTAPAPPTDLGPVRDFDVIEALDRAAGAVREADGRFAELRREQMLAVARAEYERVAASRRGPERRVTIISLRPYPAEDYAAAAAELARLRARGFKVGLGNSLVYPEMPADRYILVAGPYDPSALAQKWGMYKERVYERAFPRSLQARRP